MNTNITIRKSKTSPTGYEMVDNGKAIAIPSTYPGEPFTLVLPANAANRKYFNSKKVDAAGGSIDLDYKATKTIGPRDSTTPREPSKPLADFLEGEERDTFIRLRDKAVAAKIEANKPVPMTELEKARRAKERAEARLAELLAQETPEEKAE